MPVIVVIGTPPIPAAVLGLDGGVIPVITGVLPRNDNVFPRIAQRPNVVGIDPRHAPLDAGCRAVQPIRRSGVVGQ